MVSEKMGKVYIDLSQFYKERCDMKILTFLVIIVIIIAIVSTLLLTGKADENYSSSTKKNTANLTLIYAITIPLILIALVIFIVFFT
jgi:uncharacterized membrane protein YjgN (DUF898 family)